MHHDGDGIYPLPLRHHTQPTERDHKGVEEVLLLSRLAVSSVSLFWGVCNGGHLTTNPSTAPPPLPLPGNYFYYKSDQQFFLHTLSTTTSSSTLLWQNKKGNGSLRLVVFVRWSGWERGPDLVVVVVVDG